MNLRFTGSRSPKSTTKSTTTNRARSASANSSKTDRCRAHHDPPIPEAAPQWKHRRDRRVAVLDRFPFTLPYQIVGNEIVLLALAHTSRRPGYWTRRR